MRLTDRIRKGVLWGLQAAVVLTIWVTTIRIVRGPATFDELGASYPVVVGVYFLSGLTGGLLWGFLAPLSKSRIGIVVIAMVVMAPAGVAIHFALGYPIDELIESVLLTMGTGALVGVVIAVTDPP